MIDTSEVVHFALNERGWAEARRMRHATGRSRGREVHARRGKAVAERLAMQDRAFKFALMAIGWTAGGMMFYMLAYNGAFDIGKARPFALAGFVVSAGFAGRSWWRAWRARPAREQVAAADLSLDGEVVYSDHTLSVPSEGLVGKPDYVVRGKDGLIPVEVKSCASDSPYRWTHVLQLGCYCMLVHEEWGQRPPYGVLEYADRRIQVPFTPDLEALLRTRLARMRALAAEIEQETVAERP